MLGFAGAAAMAPKNQGIKAARLWGGIGGSFEDIVSWLAAHSAECDPSSSERRSREGGMMGPKITRDDPVISQSLDDLLIPGVIVEVDPDEADRMGVFEEDALDEATAWESNPDQ